MEGTLLASPFERLPPVGGRCRAATKRRQGVTEGDGEGAPAPLRGAAAATAEGLTNRRSEKKSATATTAASGGCREELLGQRPAGCECRPRHEADAGGRNPSAPARRNRCALAALNTRHLLRKPVCGLKAPLGLSCPPGTAVLSGSLLVPKENISRRAASSSKSP